MKIFITETSSVSKVTLSCRVTPEQKLLIAARAKELGMSLAQYGEAKILQVDDVKLERQVMQLSNENKLLQEKLTKAEKVIDDFVEYFDHELMDFCMEYEHFEVCGWENPYDDTHPIMHLKKKEMEQEIKEEVPPKEEEKVVVTPPPPQPKSPPVKKPQYPTFPIYFESKRELKIFKKQIHFLARKYDLSDIDTAVIMSVGYATENSKASFFLSTVKDFVKKYFK